MSLASLNKKKDVPDNVDLAAKTFEQHGDFIRSILHFHVKDNTLSEDLFQDFFLFLILKPIPQDVQNVRGFLYRVVSDKAKDAFRRIKRHQERMRRYADRRKCVIENCPENVMIDVEESERMFELIRQHLPPKEAQAVTLRYRDSFDVGEVAEKMGIKPRSVSRYVSAGLKKVRQVFLCK